MFMVSKLEFNSSRSSGIECFMTQTLLVWSRLCSVSLARNKIWELKATPFPKWSPCAKELVVAVNSKAVRGSCYHFPYNACFQEREKLARIVDVRSIARLVSDWKEPLSFLELPLWFNFLIKASRNGMKKLISTGCKWLSSFLWELLVGWKSATADGWKANDFRFPYWHWLGIQAGQMASHISKSNRGVDGVTAARQSG